MSKISKTFRIEKKVVDRLEDQARNQVRSVSNIVHGYIEDRVSLGDLWAAFDKETLQEVEEWLSIPRDERAAILANRQK